VGQELSSSQHLRNVADQVNAPRRSNPTRINAILSLQTGTELLCNASMQTIWQTSGTHTVKILPGVTANIDKNASITAQISTLTVDANLV